MKNKRQISVQSLKAAAAGTIKRQRYATTFLDDHAMTKRGEKAIYIRAEYHERICRIAQVIGSGKIPLYAYLDNILKHHFEMFEQQITLEYNNKLKPIF